MKRACAGFLCIALLAGCVQQMVSAGKEIPIQRKASSIELLGGHFFGPGPIEPDTALPKGRLNNVHFDTGTFSGYTQFYNDGSAAAHLSDRKTRINQNIEAGTLAIGGGTRPVLLAAVDGGRNNGREYYYLDDQYRFVWRVDLALDPGFPEGIIRIDDFILNTGIIKISESEQTQNGMPGGYDQAGSLKSGQHILGRVGDFDQNGFLDGVLVAAPRVPLESAMLPGSPVGNQRGFVTDIAIAPHLAGELTLRGLKHFKAPIKTVVEANEIQELSKMLQSLAERIEAARKNLDRALLQGEWKNIDVKRAGFGVTDELSALRALMASVAAMAAPHYTQEASRLPDSVDALLHTFFARLDKLIENVAALNKKTGVTLPDTRTQNTQFTALGRMSY